MNPFDEIAVEERFVERRTGIATEIIAVSIGKDACQETLRTALAMGADRAILLKTDIEIQPLAAAKVLKAMVEKEYPKLFYWVNKLSIVIIIKLVKCLLVY